jgi:hypothetical protein
MANDYCYSFGRQALAGKGTILFQELSQDGNAFKDFCFGFVTE